MKILVLIGVALVLTGCGGGGSDGPTPVAETPRPPEPTTVAGGPPNAPTSIGLDLKNVVGNNPFNNYFKYAGTAGERLILRVNLNVPLSEVQSARCSSSPGTGVTPSSYASQIHVYNQSNARIDGICGEDLTYSFPTTGVYVFNFEFPSNDSGYVNAASLLGAAPVKFLEAGSGSPVEPKRMSTAAANPIGSNVFLNYYWISASKGEIIVINTTLNQPLSNQQKSRCASNPGAYQTQIRVYNSALDQVGLVCGESLRFEVPQTGNYVFQFHYGSQSSGTFFGAKT